MPQTVTHVIYAADLKKDDVISTKSGSDWPYGATVDSVKVGPKWTVVRDVNGHLIRRCLSDEEVAVERQEATPEEIAEADAAKKAKHDATMREILEESVKRFVEEWKNYTHQLDGAEDLSSSSLDRLLTGQSRRRVAHRLVGIVHHIETSRIEVPAAQRYSTAAAAVWAEMHQSRSSARSPLSRSSSVLSNLIEDMNDWGWQDFFATACYGMGYSAWNELTGEALERYNAR